jgi:hypothetical protein
MFSLERNGNGRVASPGTAGTKTTRLDVDGTVIKIKLKQPTETSL